MVSVLHIGDQEYSLADVTLSAVVKTAMDNSAYLSVTIIAHSGAPSGAGFTLDTLAFHQLEYLMDLPGTTLVLDDESYDPFNELGESVVYEPGNILEIDTLDLKFGPRQADTITVEFKAMCHRKDTQEKQVLVSVKCEARILP